MLSFTMSDCVTWTHTRSGLSKLVIVSFVTSMRLFSIAKSRVCKHYLIQTSVPKEKNIWNHEWFSLKYWETSLGTGKIFQWNFQFQRSFTQRCLEVFYWRKSQTGSEGSRVVGSQSQEKMIDLTFGSSSINYHQI